MKDGRTYGITLDTGALIALDHPRRAEDVRSLIRGNWQSNGTVCVPASVIAQAWRSPRQVRLARLLKTDVDIAELTGPVSRVLGLMCARSDHHDIVDVHVALCARERQHAVITSDPKDIARVDPGLPLIQV